MEDGEMRVGELARKTGLTVRALHHWDQIGILSPKKRTGSGHRLYGPQDVRELQRILSLRSLGLSLEEIRSTLEAEAPSLETVLRSQQGRVREQLRVLQVLDGRLGQVLELLAQGRSVTTENLLQTMEMMVMIEKHFTPEQLEALKERGEALGPEAIQSAQEEWPRLIASVKEEMEAGTDPTSEKVQELAKRWKALIQAFSGGDSGIETSLGNMYKAEPDLAANQGMDPSLFRYIEEAMKGIAGE